MLVEELREKEEPRKFPKKVDTMYHKYQIQTRDHNHIK